MRFGIITALKHVFAITIASVVVCGCATIIKGPTSKVGLDAPPRTKAFDEQNERIPIYRDTDSSLYLRLASSEDHRITFRNSSREHTVLLSPRLQAGWLIADMLFPFLMIPVIVDAETGSWCTFDDIRVFEDANASPKPRTPSSETGPPSAHSEFPRGVVFRQSRLAIYAGLGFSTLGLTQIVIGPPHGRAGFSFAILPQLSVGATAEYNTHVDFPFVETEFASLHRFAMESNIYPQKNFPAYLSLGISLLNGNAESPESTNENTIIDSDWISGASFGIGYSGRWVFIEATYTRGLEPLRLPNRPEFTPGYFGFAGGLRISL